MRPKEAKDSGVGKAMDALLKNEKAMGQIGAGVKAVKSIENGADALNNIEALRSAFEIGLGKAAKAKDKEQVKILEQRVDRWRGEARTFEREVREMLTRACQILAYYEGDLEAARIGKDVLTVRSALASVAKDVDGVDGKSPAVREKFLKVKAAADIVLVKLADKDTKAGMTKYLAKTLAGYLAKGYIKPADIPDPDMREALEDQVTELRNELRSVQLRLA